jgi:succinate-acetate transporter protein
MLILHRRVGGKPTAAVMANAVVGLVGFAFACVVLHVTSEPFGAVIGLMLALSTSIAWGLIVFGARRRGITL